MPIAERTWMARVAGRWQWRMGKLMAMAIMASIGMPAIATAQTASAPAAEPKISISGYIQPRYDRFTENGETTDTVFLRRAVLAVKGLISSSWNAELQIDAGPPASRGERLLVKDAVLRDTGWDPAGVTVTIGNQKMPSRSRACNRPRAAAMSSAPSPAVRILAHLDGRSG